MAVRFGQQLREEADGQPRIPVAILGQPAPLGAAPAIKPVPHIPALPISGFERNPWRIAPAKRIRLDLPDVGDPVAIAIAGIASRQIAGLEHERADVFRATRIGQMDRRQLAGHQVIRPMPAGIIAAAVGETDGRGIDQQHPTAHHLGQPARVGLTQAIGDQRLAEGASGAQARKPCRRREGGALLDGCPGAQMAEPGTGECGGQSSAHLVGSAREGARAARGAGGGRQVIEIGWQQRQDIVLLGGCRFGMMDGTRHGNLLWGWML
ncbi:hypothetical protein [Chloroflexus sp.]|uniref:hypothetical protein n=1 Tax=Chloroflexus sp. TaxID=1904827 RepID=UPI002ACDF603|nr:hypothetical protein [Chloroflexus sp.]